MSKTAEKVNKASFQIFIFIAVLFLLLLTSLNLQNFLSPKRVLGAETNIDTKDKYWEGVVKQNPSYIPGWIELGRIDKVKEIDPNYF